jgi:palmitoyltransferase ZDHHC9/14/18
MDSIRSQSSPEEDPRLSEPSYFRAQDSEDATTNGASSRMSNAATGGDTESPPPVPTIGDMAVYPGPYHGVGSAARPLSLGYSSQIPETGPLSYSAGSLPLNRQLHQVSSEMLNGQGSASVGGRPSTAGSHIPSLTSRAFLAPMSSQKLQAHRNQRPLSQQPPPENEYGRSPTPHRNSTGSAITIRGGHALPTQYDNETLPSESRATSRASDRSEWLETNEVDRERDFREFMATQHRTTTTTTLPAVQPTEEDPRMQIQDQYIPDQQNQPRQQRSFRSGFRRDSVRSSMLSRPNGHLPLYSAEASPRRSLGERQKEVIKAELGKNHEYFTGNTVFFWGGRLQNARDKPVVLITALIIILPAILFFIFS